MSASDAASTVTGTRAREFLTSMCTRDVESCARVTLGRSEEVALIKKVGVMESWAGELQSAPSLFLCHVINQMTNVYPLLLPWHDLAAWQPGAPG